MYKYAEVKHGKIIKLYNDERLLEDFVALFSNETFFLDVTTIQCDVGWIVELDENLCITNLKPPTKSKDLAKKENSWSDCFWVKRELIINGTAGSNRKMQKGTTGEEEEATTILYQ